MMGVVWDVILRSVHSCAMGSYLFADSADASQLSCFVE